MGDMDAPQAPVKGVGQHDYEVMLLHISVNRIVNCPKPLLPRTEASDWTATGALQEDERTVRIAHRVAASQGTPSLTERQGRAPALVAKGPCFPATNRLNVVSAKGGRGNTLCLTF